MPQSPEHHMEHATEIQAPPEAVFELIASVEQWPQIFPPTIHAERLEHHEGRERIRLWATANGEVKNWTSHRTLDRDRLRIVFRQEVSRPPVAAMSGEWIVEPPAPGRGSTRVRLTHTFRALDDTAQHTDWIRRAVDRNSDSELAALRSAAERRAAGCDLEFSFEDSLTVDGAPKDVYDFLNEAGHWPDRLPHVARVALEESSPGVQSLEMDTRGPDGSVHTTRSIRICRPYDSIVYKQLHTPALLAAHTGRWSVVEDGTTTRLASAHSVVLAPSAIQGVLGEGATVAGAREFVRGALSRNSTATMLRAKEHAENRRTVG